MNRFWTVTSFYNPVRYRRRLQNYRVFRSKLVTPLLAVEHSLDGNFELTRNDADIVIQVAGGDCMWQKERLLNVGIANLPADCDYLAWIDNDIVLERSNWPQQAVSLLRQAKLCQLYRRVWHLRKDTPEDAINVSNSTLFHDSEAWARSEGLASPAIPLPVGPHVPQRKHFKRGHAWCAVREDVARHGLYDRNVIGGGDSMMAFAALGEAARVVEGVRVAPGHAEDYMQWARRFGERFRGLSYVDQEIFHLWHGDLVNRNYSDRHQILRDHGFDPAIDIAVDQGGAWKWNSAKNVMHAAIADYFRTRAEDGEEPAIARGVTAASGIR
jgi:hypothetical protein